jgi:DNA-binding CsgD family transcriptional regulator
MSSAGDPKAGDGSAGSTAVDSPIRPPVPVAVEPTPSGSRAGYLALRASVGTQLWEQLLSGSCHVLLQASNGNCSAHALLPGFKSEDVILQFEMEGLQFTVMRSYSLRPELNLSPREYEIARMVAKGYANKTIAAVLNISAWTVSTHLRRMFVKLNVSSRAELVARLMADLCSTGDKCY